MDEHLIDGFDDHMEKEPVTDKSNGKENKNDGEENKKDGRPSYKLFLAKNPPAGMEKFEPGKNRDSNIFKRFCTYSDKERDDPKGNR
jgi:hypothetical protein